MVSYPSASTVPYLDACGATGSRRVIPSADDSGAAATLPFATRWWGAALMAGSSMYVSSNGFLLVAPVATANSTSGTIPDAMAPNGLIAAQWRDLLTRDTGACIATLGTAPSRRWVAQWDNASNYPTGTGSLNFEVIVHEGSGIIDLAYGVMSMSDTTRTTTVGLESPDGLRAVGGCTDGTSLCVSASNTRARFTPAP